MNPSGTPAPTPHHTGDVGPLPWWLCAILVLIFSGLLVAAMLRAKGRGKGTTWN